MRAVVGIEWMPQLRGLDAPALYVVPKSDPADCEQVRAMCARLGFTDVLPALGISA